MKIMPIPNPIFIRFEKSSLSTIDCQEKFSNISLAPMRMAFGYYIGQAGATTLRYRTHNIAVALFTALIALAWIPVTLVGLVLLSRSKSHAAHYQGLQKLSSSSAPISLNPAITEPVPAPTPALTSQPQSLQAQAQPLIPHPQPLPPPSQPLLAQPSSIAKPTHQSALRPTTPFTPAALLKQPTASTPRGLIKAMTLGKAFEDRDIVLPKLPIDLQSFNKDMKFRIGDPTNPHHDSLCNALHECSFSFNGPLVGLQLYRAIHDITHNQAKTLGKLTKVLSVSTEAPASKIKDPNDLPLDECREFSIHLAKVIDTQFYNVIIKAYARLDSLHANSLTRAFVAEVKATKNATQITALRLAMPTSIPKPKQNTVKNLVTV